MKKLTLLVLALVGSLCGYSQIIEYPKHQISAFIVMVTRCIRDFLIFSVEELTKTQVKQKEKKVGNTLIFRTFIM